MESTSSDSNALGSPEILGLKASVHLEHGRYNDAISEYKKLLHIQSEAPDSEKWYNLGIVLRQSGNNEEAMEHLVAVRDQRSVDLGKSHILTLKANHAIATVYEFQGDYHISLKTHKET